MMLSMPGGFFSEPVGVPIYGFFFEGGQICRITEIAMDHLKLSHNVKY